MDDEAYRRIPARAVRTASDGSACRNRGQPGLASGALWKKPMGQRDHLKYIGRHTKTSVSPSVIEKRERAACHSHFWL
jgi:hypothetical protein